MIAFRSSCIRRHIFPPGRFHECTNTRHSLPHSSLSCNYLFHMGSDLTHSLNEKKRVIELEFFFFSPFSSIVNAGFSKKVPRWLLSKRRIIVFVWSDENEGFRVDDAVHPIHCRICIFFAFSCGLAETIWMRYVWIRTLLKTGEKSPFLILSR